MATFERESSNDAIDSSDRLVSSDRTTSSIDASDKRSIAGDNNGSKTATAAMASGSSYPSSGGRSDVSSDTHGRWRRKRWVVTPRAVEVFKGGIPKRGWRQVVVNEQLRL